MGTGHRIIIHWRIISALALPATQREARLRGQWRNMPAMIIEGGGGDGADEDDSKEGWAPSNVQSIPSTGVMR
jgi:hypothetical protein